MNQPSDFVGAKQAAKLLGVRLPTLYAYASRGLVTSVPSGEGRARLYARADLMRLRARGDARSGHAAVAGGALRWGDPVLESSITEIGAGGPRYRGRLAVDLARQRVPFESVCALLWAGSLPAVPPQMHGKAGVRPRAGATSYVERLLCAAPTLAPGDPLSSPLQAAGGLVRALAAALAPDARGAAAAHRAPTVARAALASFGVEAGEERVAVVDQVLVLCADHELNVSAFSARVVSSAGATLPACVTAALAAFSGPAHGAASDRVEALLDEIGSPERARAVLSERVRRGEAIPGFGHPLYTAGDPRGAELFAVARASRSRAPRMKVLETVVRAMHAAEQPAPNLDAGLVAVRVALGLPRGAASALFALGRSAGWVAHALEQREQGFLLRPRARYVAR
ncbi:MAG: citrate synthase [Polyangiaceae bacterium]|nr:citrate synthase [Polyangiaceae bacterium]